MISLWDLRKNFRDIILLVVLHASGGRNLGNSIEAIGMFSVPGPLLGSIGR